MSSPAYLHRMASVLDQRRREALAGTCTLADCDQPASGFIEGWDLRPEGICDSHTTRAVRLGYTVHATLED